MTLEEFANQQQRNGMGSATPTKVVSMSPVNAITNSTATSMVPVSIETITSRVGKEPEKENTVDAPLVKDAFKALDSALKRKKEGTMQLLETMEKNAREDSIDHELGETDIVPVSEDVKITPADDCDTFSLEEALDYIGNSNNTSDIEKELFGNNYAAVGEIKVSTPDETTVDNPTNTQEPREVTNNSTIKVEDNTSFVVADKTQDQNAITELMHEIENMSTEQSVVDDEEETVAEARDRIKKNIEPVKVLGTQYDLKSFTIQQKPVSSSTLLNNLRSNKTIKTADWPLYHSKKVCTFRECGGLELDTLRKNISAANGINAVIIALRFYYDHIIDSNKPPFEAWCKTIRSEDMESLPFGVFKATYSNANFIRRDCLKHNDPKTNSPVGCGKSSYIQYNIDDMVQFGLDDSEKAEIKTNFDNIMHGDTTTEDLTKDVQITQIADNLAMAYSPASLYSTYIQYATLRPDLAQKYDELLNTMAYINGFYYINPGDKSLNPIAIKEYPNNLNKSVLSKLQVYMGILSAITSDQYSYVIGLLNNLIKPADVYYKIPECVCPECGAVIPEELINANNDDVTSMLSLLFMRAQLARIKSI